MADLKRFNGNPAFTAETISDGDVIPFQHDPNGTNDVDGKITVSNLKTKLTEDVTPISTLDTTSAHPVNSSAVNGALAEYKAVMFNRNTSGCSASMTISELILALIDSVSMTAKQNIDFIGEYSNSSYIAISDLDSVKTLCGCIHLSSIWNASTGQLAGYANFENNFYTIRVLNRTVYCTKI